MPHLSLSVVGQRCRICRRYLGYSTILRMSSEKHLMFVYGTLKRQQPNNHFMTETDSGTAEFVSSGHTTNKYPLVIAGKYNIPYLLYLPGKGHHVQGDIYEVDIKKRNFMDDFESHPMYYERLEESIVLDNSEDCVPKTVKCWVYFMKNYKPDMLELATMGNYDSRGSHGLEYVERYRRTTSAYEEFKKS